MITSLSAASGTMYYADKLGSLRDIFGAEAVELVSDGVVIDGVTFPIIDDVIIDEKLFLITDIQYLRQYFVMKI